MDTKSGLVSALLSGALLFGCVSPQAPSQDTTSAAEHDSEKKVTGEGFTLSQEQVDELMPRYDEHFPQSNLENVLDATREEITQPAYSAFRETGNSGFNGSIDILYMEVIKNFGIKETRVLATVGVDETNAAAYDSFIAQARNTDPNTSAFVHINTSPQISGPDVHMGLSFNGLAVPGITVIDENSVIAQTKPLDLPITPHNGFVLNEQDRTKALNDINDLFPNPHLDNLRFLTTEFLESESYIQNARQNTGGSFLAFVQDTINDSRASGRKVVLGFGAEWCPPCVPEHKDLVAAARLALEKEQAGGDPSPVFLDVLIDTRYVGPHSFSPFLWQYNVRGNLGGVPSYMMFREDGEQILPFNRPYDINEALALFENPPDAVMRDAKVRSIALANRAVYETKDEIVRVEPFFAIGDELIGRTLEDAEEIVRATQTKRTLENMYRTGPASIELLDYVGEKTGVLFPKSNLEVYEALALYSPEYNLDAPCARDIVGVTQDNFILRAQHYPDNEIYPHVLSELKAFERRLELAGGVDYKFPSIHRAARMTIGDRDPILITSNDDVVRVFDEIGNVSLRGPLPNTEYGSLIYPGAVTKEQGRSLLDIYSYNFAHGIMAEHPDGGYVFTFDSQ